MTRLIDADALITAVLKKAIDYAVVFGDSEMHRLLVQVIAHQPTIDAIPIEWLIRMRNKHNNDGFAWIYEAVMDDWREEHAKTD